MACELYAPYRHLIQTLISNKAFKACKSPCVEIEIFTPVTISTTIYVCCFDNGRNSCRITGRMAERPRFILSCARKKTLLRCFVEGGIPGAISPIFCVIHHCRFLIVPRVYIVRDGLNAFATAAGFATEDCVISRTCCTPLRWSRPQSFINCSSNLRVYVS